MGCNYQDFSSWRQLPWAGWMVLDVSCIRITIIYGTSPLMYHVVGLAMILMCWRWIRIVVVVHILTHWLVVLRGSGACACTGNRAVIMSRSGITWDLGKIAILRKRICVVVFVCADVGCAGWSLADAAAARKDVVVGSGDGPNGLFWVAIICAGGAVPHWWLHVHGSGLIQAVQVALHLIQETLLLSFRNATETHSCRNTQKKKPSAFRNCENVNIYFENTFSGILLKV